VPIAAVDCLDGRDTDRRHDARAACESKALPDTFRTIAASGSDSLYPMKLPLDSAAPARRGVISANLFWCAFGTAMLAGSVARAAAPVLSEDFEAGSLDKAVWETRTAGSVTVTVQQAQVAHGKSALQVHYPAGSRGSIGFIVASHLPDAVRTHCFGRAYVYISPGMPAGHDVLVTTGTAGYPTSNFLEVGVSGGKNVNLSYQQNAANVPRGETLRRGSAYPVGRWFCLEWELQDHPNRIVTWIDGEQVGELADFTFKPRAATLLQPNGAAKVDSLGKKGEAAAEVAPVPGTDLVKEFVDFAFGFRAWGGATKEDFDIYYDDIVIGTQRIGPIK
jgi:hypothetical protein